MDILKAKVLIDTHRGKIDSLSPTEREADFKKTLVGLKSFGFNSVSELFDKIKENELDFPSAVDGMIKNIVIVHLNDYRITPLIPLRRDNLIQDTLYIGTPQNPVILATPQEYRKLNLDYCTTNGIQVFNGMKHAVHFYCKGVMTFGFLTKKRIELKPDYLRHFVFKTLVACSKDVRKRNNDLIFNDRKVFGVGKMGLHTPEGVDLIQGFLDLNITKEQRDLFLNAYVDKSEAIALKQMGTLNLPILTFAQKFLQVLDNLGFNVIERTSQGAERDALNNAGVCF